MSLPSGIDFAGNTSSYEGEYSAMSVPRYAYSRDMREYERKLRQHHPMRNLVMSLVGFFAVLMVVGVAVIVALSPTLSLYPAIRSLTGHG
jgi:type IV secretory pathway component VirB8